MDANNSHQPPAWVEVTLVAPGPQAEAAADFLVTLSGQGVAVNELTAPAGCVQVTGYLAGGAELPRQREMVVRFASGLEGDCDVGGVKAMFRDLTGEDWGENWRQYFKPQAVSRSLVVAPPWEQPGPSGGRSVIVIDPGQAFGTGQHESTRLCLQHLDAMAACDILADSLLDVGCGTGILALAGLTLGAGHAAVLDIDPVALAAARHNAQLNGLERQLEILEMDVAALDRRFPLVLANLTGKDLMELAEPLAARVAAGGCIIASGFLVEQANGVAAAFEARGLKEMERASLAGWSSLVMG